MQNAIILYENGKAIGGEGHPTNASDITFDNTGTDLVSENVENAIKEVNTKKQERGTVLWSNPSPTASFSAQNISLSSSNYDVLDWYFLTQGIISNMTTSLKGYSTALTYSASAIMLSRQITRSSDTVYAVGDAYRYHTDTKANDVNNMDCVPIKVVGRKL